MFQLVDMVERGECIINSDDDDDGGGDNDNDANE